MNGLQLRMLLAAGVSALLGSLGLPASAHCHSHMHHSHHMHCSHIHMHHYSHHSTTLTSSTLSPAANDQRDPLKEQASILETKIMKLDREITQSLEKITELQIFQSDDQANPHKNDDEIASERVTLDNTEQSLSEALQQKSEIQTQLNPRSDNTDLE